MFTYISIEEFADGVVKNNKDANRRELIAALRESLAAKKNGARCMICGAPIWAAGSAITGTNMCFTCTTGEADDSEDYEIEKNEKRGAICSALLLDAVFLKTALSIYPVPKHIA